MLQAAGSPIQFLQLRLDLRDLVLDIREFLLQLRQALRAQSQLRLLRLQLFDLHRLALPIDGLEIIEMQEGRQLLLSGAQRRDGFLRGAELGGVLPLLVLQTVQFLLQGVALGRVVPTQNVIAPVADVVAVVFLVPGIPVFD